MVTFRPGPSFVVQPADGAASAGMTASPKTSAPDAQHAHGAPTGVPGMTSSLLALGRVST